MPTAVQISLYPGNIPAPTQLTVVSMAARGSSLQRIADATTLPISTVQAIGRHFGAPNLGTLTNSADALRAHLEHTPDGQDTGVGIHPALHDIRTAAEQLGATKLVRRVDWLQTQIGQLHVDLDTARTAHTAKAAAKLKADKLRRAQAQQLEQNRAAAAELAAQLREHEAAAADLEAQLNRLTPDERRRCRLWAAEQKLDCPQMGRIPNAVTSAWTNAGRP